MNIIELDKASSSLVATIGVLNIPPVQKKAYIQRIARSLRKGTGLKNVVVLGIEDNSTIKLNLFREVHL